MKYFVAVAALIFGIAAQSAADVTLKTITSATTGTGTPSNTPGTIYIKGNRMRSDVDLGTRVQSTVLDLEAQKIYVFDSVKPEADVWDMPALAARLSSGADTATMSASVTPNGQTRDMAGLTGVGYQLEVSVSPGVDTPTPVTAMLSGPVWIVKDAPGAADYARFYRAAADRGFIFIDPRAAAAQPASARAMAEMYRRIAEIGGIPYASEIQLRLAGSGALAAALAKLGNLSITTSVQSVSTDPVAEDVFAPPPGYAARPRN